ncbi:MAG: 50S ribosomal protein L29 [Acidobacteria bacterium]|nr:50S ribosomal protein L29 [Acidobacteriota bacterium]MCZ6769333.1 50S ribosomal protein L29 [Acidobacteriota bacterium]MCZ6879434.1 50S ribosomal protein L29 [Acidobacteriota bacterium]
MKASKFREMSREELETEAAASSEQLFRLRLQKATGQLENVMKIGQVRKDLARIKTVLTEKEKEKEKEQGFSK